MAAPAVTPALLPGAVGGLVGSLGALGGFFLPLLFAYAAQWTGIPQSTFFVLFAVTAVAMPWMHLTIHRTLHATSPDLATKFEHAQVADPAAAHESLAEPVAVGATTMERTEG
jgi:NNP family nitrate/nitrite transporter-like MFS transporter